MLNECLYIIMGDEGLVFVKDLFEFFEVYYAGFRS